MRVRVQGEAIRRSYRKPEYLSHLDAHREKSYAFAAKSLSEYLCQVGEMVDLILLILGLQSTMEKSKRLSSHFKIPGLNRKQKNHQLEDFVAVNFSEILELSNKFITEIDTEQWGHMRTFRRRNSVNRFLGL